MDEKPKKPADRALLSSAEARDAQAIIMLFERIKGQGATAEESAALEGEIAAVRDAKP